MKRLEELKNRIDSLESKYEGFREGVDYTVSVDKEGRKFYDIQSEELRKSVFGNFREEGVISPYLRRGLEDNQNRRILPANTLNTPFWNEVWRKNNNLLEESGSSKTKELERIEKVENTKTSKEKVDSGSQQAEALPQTDYQKWLEVGKKQGWLTIAITIPVLFSLFFKKDQTYQ